MKLLLYFILIITFTFGEDFALLLEQKNDNFNLPQIDSSISFNEYELLSTTIGLKDIGYSLIIPGYIHYKAKDNIGAYYLMSIRLLSYTSMMITYYDGIRQSNKEQSSSTTLNYLNMDTKHKLAFDTAFNIAIATFLYDWIIGVNILSNKQNLIRYKYGWKLNFKTNIENNSSTILSLEKKF